MVLTEEGIVKEPVSPEHPLKACSAMLVIVGSRVISPEQQEEEGVFLLMQLYVIPWTEEDKRRKSQRDGEIVGRLTILSKIRQNDANFQLWRNDGLLCRVWCVARG
jgi:hypothetical protein